MTCLPCASRARARWRTSNADSIPIRVIRSAICILLLSRRSCVAWFDADQRGIVLFGQQVEITVRTLTHVADPLAELTQHRLPPHLFPLVVELDALELPGARDLALPQTADEQVAFTSRELVAGVEGHA